MSLGGRAENIYNDNISLHAAKQEQWRMEETHLACDVLAMSHLGLI